MARRKVEASLKRYGVKDLKKFFTVLENSPVRVIYEELEEVSEQIIKEVKARIEAQPPSWPPLTEKYLEWKIATGRDPRKLVSTKEYLNSIGVQRIRRGKTGFELRVGLPNAEHSEAGINYNYLARIHENGTRTIPARPHWGPVYRLWSRKLYERSRDYMKKIKKQIEKDLKKGIISKRNAKDIK